MSALDITLDPSAGRATTILRLRGRATYVEAPQLRAAVFGAIAEADGRNLVVELEEVNRIDTAALAVLVEALMATRDSETTIFLMHPSESVRRVFRMAGLEEALMNCFDCWDDFRTALLAG